MIGDDDDFEDGEEYEDEEYEDEEFDETESPFSTGNMYRVFLGKRKLGSSDPGFADPGGQSALRAETEDNPRNRPCPTCGAADVLTPADVRLGYQCNRCAEATEGGW